MTDTYYFSLYVEDANGTIYVAERVGWLSNPERRGGPFGKRKLYEDDEPVFRLVEQPAVAAEGHQGARALSALTVSQVARVLADEGWEGRWRPKDFLNTLPIAEHTAQVLSDAGYDVVKRTHGPEGDQ